MPRRSEPDRRWVSALSLAAVAVVATLGILLAVALTAVWPITVGLAAVVAGIVAAARRAPAWALAAAVLLVGFEGSIKILLGLEPTPVPFSPREVGAVAIDVALFAAVAGVIVAGPRVSPRRAWDRASRVERLAVAMLGGWLALSILQIATTPHLAQALHGFRLLQAYVVVAVAAAVVAAGPRSPRRTMLVMLGVAGCVALYAAVRAFTGLAPAELHYVGRVETMTAYGNLLRDIGSFSGAVGLASFLTPVAVTALVAGFLVPRVRRLALPVAAAALVGLVGSYTRAALWGVVVGLVCALLLFASLDAPRRQKLVAIGLVAAALGLTYGGVRLAAHTHWQLEGRAKGLLDPIDDSSVKGRVRLWGDAIASVGRNPFGRGLGIASAARDPGTRVTTDNSFLQVLVEQGVVGFVLFTGGVVGAVAAVAGRLRRTAGERRALGVAALAGWVGFLALSLAGEYFEQPGKVAAWGLLGMAAGLALPPPGAAEPLPAAPRRLREHMRAVAARASRRRRGAAAAAVGALVLGPTAVELARASSFEASAELVPRSVGPFPAPAAGRYYQHLLRDPLMRLGVYLDSGYDIAYERPPVISRDGARRAARLTASAATPAHARDLANAFAREVSGASGRELEARAKRARDALAARLRARPPAPFRERIRARLRTIGPIARASSPRVVTGRRARAPRPTRLADRFAAALPGDHPGRPSPGWAALAGLVVAAALFAVGAALPRRPQPVTRSGA